ncbi:Phytocyanin domain [Dillenia turbinata]|uniref:Basic blue protein n=1 Tax=Dillenia turbinata TaxID=194707 RepID=A0AAN8VE06_9MAGN
MAHQGRGNSFEAIAMATILLVSLSLHLNTVRATDFIVGDANGWGFNVQSWSNGKNFKVGDNLVFKYNPQAHNVVKVDANGYQSCSAAPGSPTYTSGNDKIALSKGPNYFICTVPGHCSMGMKVQAIAS